MFVEKFVRMVWLLMISRRRERYNYAVLLDSGRHPVCVNEETVCFDRFDVRSHYALNQYPSGRVRTYIEAALLLHIQFSLRCYFG